MKAGISFVFMWGDEVVDVAVKGAKVFGKCAEFAKDFHGKFWKIIKNAGGEVKHWKVDIGKNGFIGTISQQLSNNGYHEFIEVIHDGK